MTQQSTAATGTQVNAGGRAIVSVLALAGIAAASTQTLVVPLIGQFPRILHVPAATSAWVLTATALASAIVIPAAGRLGDMIGKRTIFLASMVPLMAGSVVCAHATSLWPMIAGRALEGLGMGVVPLGIALVRDLVPPERLGSSIAFMSASMGIGGAVGLPIAAAVDQYVGWRWMFWGIAALCAAILVAVWRLIPAPRRSMAVNDFAADDGASVGHARSNWCDSGPGNSDGTPTGRPRAARFDIVGTLGLSAGLAGLLLAVSHGGQWGWLSLKTLGLGAGALLVLVVWAAWEWHSTHPLVDLRIARRPQVLLTNLTSVLIGFALYSQSVVLPQLLQLPTATGYGFGQSMIAMALWLAPAGIVMMAVSPLGAQLTAARGPKTTLVVGAIIMAGGYGSYFLLGRWAAGLMAVSMITNVGLGLAYGAMPTIVLRGVPAGESASATSLNTLVRSLGTSIAAAAVGAVLGSMTIRVGGASLPSAGAFHISMLIGLGVSVAAALLAMTIPSGLSGAQPDREPATSSPAPEPDSPERVRVQVHS